MIQIFHIILISTPLFKKISTFSQNLWLNYLHPQIIFRFLFKYMIYLFFHSHHKVH